MSPLSLSKRGVWFWQPLVVLCFSSIDCTRALLPTQRNFSSAIPWANDIVQDVIIKLSSTEKSKLLFCECLPSRVGCELCQRLCSTEERVWVRGSAMNLIKSLTFIASPFTLREKKIPTRYVSVLIWNMDLLRLSHIPFLEHRRGFIMPSWACSGRWTKSWC